VKVVPSLGAISAMAAAKVPVAVPESVTSAPVKEPVLIGVENTTLKTGFPVVGVGPNTVIAGVGCDQVTIT
jgi:hypothetical protein